MIDPIELELKQMLGPDAGHNLRLNLNLGCDKNVCIVEGE